jgi:hypothetical protein
VEMSISRQHLDKHVGAEVLYRHYSRIHESYHNTHTYCHDFMWSDF